MNLYTIDFSHSSPKDRKYGIKGLVLAENNEQVYEWLCTQPEINDETLFVSWKDDEEEYEDETFRIYDNEGKEIGEVLFKEKIIHLQGEIYDDDVDYDGAYYGVTLYGWSLLKENVTTDYSELIDLNLLVKL